MTALAFPAGNGRVHPVSAVPVPLRERCSLVAGSWGVKPGFYRGDWCVHVVVHRNKLASTRRELLNPHYRDGFARGDIFVETVLEGIIEGECRQVSIPFTDVADPDTFGEILQAHAQASIQKAWREGMSLGFVRSVDGVTRERDWWRVVSAFEAGPCACEVAVV